MSHPPEFPGSRRLKRVAKNTGGSAYEGAFEAVGAILIATMLGYWFDEHFETTPTGVIVGAAVGFGAFVVRLVRMGRQFHPGPDKMAGETAGREAEGTRNATGTGREAEPREEPDAIDESVGVGLGLSDVLRHADEEDEH